MDKDFDRIFTFQNLYLAHKKARLCKRFKKEVVIFETSLGPNLAKLFFDLKSGRYKIEGYNTFYITEPKKRRVDALSYKDRIVQHCVCDNYLMPYLEKHLIYDNAATRKGKGTDFARKRLKKFYVDYYNKHKSNVGYVLKCDIHHYFENVDHSILKDLIAKKLNDTRINNLLFKIIDSFYVDNQNVGLPIGNQTSQAFAIWYLDEMDRMIKEKYQIRGYIRYMDDFILISESKDELKKVLAGIKTYLAEERRLELNVKTRIYKLSQSVEFVGFNYVLHYDGQVTMRINRKRRAIFLKRVNSKKKDFLEGKIDKETLKQTYVSYIGHLKRGENYKYLSKIEKALNSNIRVK